MINQPNAAARYITGIISKQDQLLQVIALSAFMPNQLEV
jgi:hypothetical protein